MQDAADFARQQNARALAEAKIPRVLVEILLAEADANFCRADVRRFGDDAHGREQSKRFMIVQDFPGKGEMSLLAIKLICQLDGSLVQRARHDDDFEC